jgi:hypothetical protein
MLFVLVAFTGIALSPSHAQSPFANEAPADGNRIPEPRLADYSNGSRTPGFSPITDIEYR